MIRKAKSFIEIERALEELVGFFVMAYSWDEAGLLLSYEANKFYPHRYQVQVVFQEEIGAPRMEIRSIDTRTFGPLVNSFPVGIADIDWEPTERERAAELCRRNPSLIDEPRKMSLRLMSFN